MNKMMDIAAEKRLLAGLLAYPESYAKVVNRISRNSFSSDKCKFLFDCIKEFNDFNPLIRITNKTLAQIVKGKNPKDKILIVKVITQIFQTECDESEIYFLAQRLEELRKWRIMMDGIAEIATNAGNGMDLPRAINKFNDTQAELMVDERTMSEMRWNTDESIKSRLLHIKEMQLNPEKFKGCPIGISEYDEHTGGLREGELGVMMLSTGKGKTHFLCHVSLQAAMRSNNVIFITVESSERGILSRLDSALTGIPHEHFRKATLTKKEVRQLVRDIKKRRAGSGMFDIIDIPDGCSANMLKAIIRQKEAKYKPDLVIVDYMNIMSTNRGETGMYDWRVQLQISVEMKRLARQCKVPIWSAIQMNKNDQASFASNILDNLDFALTCVEPENVLGTLGYRWLTIKKSREVDASKKFIIHHDFSRMRFDDGKRPTKLEMDALKNSEETDE